VRGRGLGRGVTGAAAGRPTGGPAGPGAAGAAAAPDPRAGGPARAGFALVSRLCLCVLVAAPSACGGPERGVASVGTAADSADQVMMGVRQFLTKDGVRQAFLQADTAFVYETSGRVDLKRVHVTFYSTEGVQESVLTGRDGTYWTRTNQMSARGDVVVVRTSDQARLRTDFLEYDPSKNEVRTDRPWVADKGEQHFEGLGFTCDPGFTNCTSTNTRGTAGRLVMPRQ
jgi:LPS export ABC transporter protein LptC